MKFMFILAVILWIEHASTQLLVNIMIFVSWRKWYQLWSFSDVCPTKNGMWVLQGLRVSGEYNLILFTKLFDGF
jgi:hypothetical protein